MSEMREQGWDIGEETFDIKWDHEIILHVLAG